MPVGPVASRPAPAPLTTFVAGLAVLALAACDPDVAAPLTCDVLDSGCATGVARGVAAVYELDWPRARTIDVVIPGGGSSSSSSASDAATPPDYDDLELDAYVDALPRPLAWLFEPWADAGGPLDPALGEGPTPSGLGRLDTVSGEPWVRYVIGSSWTGDDAGVPRRRLAGLVAHAASRLRHDATPDHMIDAWTWSEPHASARWAYRLGVGHLLLAQVEAGGRVDTAPLVAALDELVDVAWDPEHTPSRHTISDLSRYAGLRALALLYDELGGDWRAVDDALAVGPGPCLRELIWPSSAPCVALRLPDDVPDGDAGLVRVGTRQIGAALLAHRLAELANADGESSADARALGSGLAGHVGIIRYRFDDDAVVTTDLMRWDDAQQAEDFAAFIAEEPEVLDVLVVDADVRVIAGPEGVDPQPFLDHLGLVTLLDEPPGSVP